MSKLTLTGLALPLFLLFASPPASAPKAFGATKDTPESQGQTGTLQKMIVQSGSVTMQLDLNRLNGIATPCIGQYVFAQIGGSIVPGTTDSGNHGDNQVTNIPLPWTSHNYTIFLYWDDQRTDANSGCSAFSGGNCGVFTSVSGTAPHRIFNIEWRTVYFADPTTTANYELRLYEGGLSRFDVVWGAVASGNTSATAGVQRDTFLTQYFCNGSGGAATGGQSYLYFPPPCPTPTPRRSSPPPRPRPTPPPRP